MPELVELLVLLVGTGLTPVLAFGELAEAAPPPLRPGVAEVLARLRAGERFSEALIALTDLHGDALDAFVGILAHADRYGEPLPPVLDRLAADARQERRRLAEAASRRLPVRLCGPLVGCTLPAFVLLTIVPMLIGTFSSVLGRTR